MATTAKVIPVARSYEGVFAELLLNGVTIMSYELSSVAAGMEDVGKV